VQEHTIYGQEKTTRETRHELGLPDVQLPQPFAPLLDVPIRLLQWVAPPLQAVLPEPEVGDLVGSPLPKNVITAQAKKAELNRWKTVAIKAIKAGKNPAEREFTSEILDTNLQIEIMAELRSARTEQEVKTVFETVPFWQYP
jgi:hypothetical protein